MCLAIGLWTWLANPVANLLILLEPAGREAMPSRRKQALVVSGALIATALVLLAVNLVVNSAGLAFSAIGAGLFTIPLTMTLKARRGWPRRMLTGLSIVLALAGLSTVGMLVATALLSVNVPRAETLIVSGILIFFGGIPLSMVLASILGAAFGDEAS